MYEVSTYRLDAPIRYPQIPSKYLECYGLTRNDKAIIPPNHKVHNMACSKAASSLSSLVKARVET